MWLPLTHPILGTWPTTQACALDWELNWRPFGSQASTQSTKPHQPGPHSFLSPQSSLTLNKWKVECVCKLYMDQEVEVKILITWCNMGHSHITKQFSSFQQILTRCLTNVAYFCHYVPSDIVRSCKLRAQSHKTAPTSDASCKSRLLSDVLIDQLYCSEVSVAYSMGLINLLMWLTDSEKHLTS